MQPIAPANPPAASEARIGHVHLKVADLDRAIAFYSGVLGFDVMQRYGDQAAFSRAFRSEFGQSPIAVRASG